MIGTTISHYKILEKLGEGGMGVVYRALDTKLDRSVAIKFLPAHLSGAAENKTRFVQEAQSTAALNHPNILNVYDIDEQSGGLFFVMEYIEGKTLKQYMTSLKAGEGIPVTQAIDWTIQIAQGLKAAHEKTIVHRDIKPENIMLTKDHHPKIMDFGIAKLKGGTGLTKTGTSLGTLSYMSPEQAQGTSADQRSDIWSLGVVFYEMLTNEVPFRGEHEAALMYLIVNEHPHPPSQIDRRVAPQVDSVVMKMLEKDRAIRYQNMEEVIKALQAVKAELSSAQTGKTKSIAVLPFANMSTDQENEYFSDGLTEEIIANLSRLKDMKIIARTTSMQYKGTKKDVKTIGRELGARYIIEGSVRKFQNDLRITAQFIDVEDGTQLWAGTYKGTLADVFDFQEQVSKQIVDALAVKLTPVEQVALTKRSTLNAEAFDYYLRARGFLYRLTKGNTNISIQLFQKAIELDGRFAAAYAGLGEAYAYLYQHWDRRESWLEKAVESSLKAQLYDPTLSEAFAALGVAYFNKKAFEDALTAGNKAIELDPNNHIAYWILGRIYRQMDRDHDSVELFKKTFELNPDFYTALGDLRMVYERIGDRANSEEMLRYSLEYFPKYLLRHPEDARAHMFFATNLAELGHKEEAKVEAAKALELSPGETVILYNAACFYSQLGEKALSVQTLNDAVASGWQDFEWIKRDPDFDNIRNEAGYIELMKGK
ncbi:MAG TPA: protein kinase [Bacteroidota bacterium]|jgi:serine/threonine protein kinase/Flp pilus assembly protein TadD|nr:protein kinase [Bacteroidota bacterium]